MLFSISQLIFRSKKYILAKLICLLEKQNCDLTCMISDNSYTKKKSKSWKRQSIFIIKNFYVFHLLLSISEMKLVNFPKCFSLRKTFFFTTVPFKKTVVSLQEIQKTKNVGKYACGRFKVFLPLHFSPMWKPILMKLNWIWETS